MTHVRDQKSSATVVPWHPSSKSAPDERVMCEGRLHTTMEAYADVTRCELCDYYAYWGVGD